MPKPSLMDLSPDFAQQALGAKNPHLAIEALRDLLTEEAGHAARSNLVRQRAFSERLTELMNRYTNQQLTSAEVIAERFATALDGINARTYGPPGLEEDIAFCAQESVLDVVPRFTRMVGPAAEVVA